MSEKNTEKKYTKEDFDNFTTKFKNDFNKSIPKMECRVSTDSYGTSPEFEIKIRGGSLEEIHSIAYEIIKNVIKKIENMEVKEPSIEIE